MSLILAKRALCQDPADYESLLPTLTIAKNLLDCATDGKVQVGPSVDIFKKLFGNAADSVWYSEQHSCFEDTHIYYSKKACSNECGFGEVVWNPDVDTCLSQAIGIAVNDPLVDLTTITTFKQIAEKFALYLGNNLTDQPLENVLKVIDSFCDLVEQKISIRRTLRKTGLTIDHCDF